MRAFTIPTSDEPYYVQTVSLDETRFVFQFTYSVIEEAWLLDVMDSANSPLVQGIKLVTGADLFEPYRYKDGFPQGALVVLSSPGDNSVPKLEELGEDRRCKLTYLAEFE